MPRPGWPLVQEHSVQSLVQLTRATETCDRVLAEGKQAATLRKVPRKALDKTTKCEIHISWPNSVTFYLGCFYATGFGDP
jgi:hypothetical protein